jgi:hypothetical protein
MTYYVVCYENKDGEGGMWAPPFYTEAVAQESVDWLRREDPNNKAAWLKTINGPMGLGWDRNHPLGITVSSASPSAAS